MPSLNCAFPSISFPSYFFSSCRLLILCFWIFFIDSFSLSSDLVSFAHTCYFFSFKKLSGWTMSGPTKFLIAALILNWGICILVQNSFFLPLCFDFRLRNLLSCPFPFLWHFRSVAVDFYLCQGGEVVLQKKKSLGSISLFLCPQAKVHSLWYICFGMVQSSFLAKIFTFRRSKASNGNCFKTNFSGASMMFFPLLFLCFFLFPSL